MIARGIREALLIGAVLLLAVAQLPVRAYADSEWHDNLPALIPSGDMDRTGTWATARTPDSVVFTCTSCPDVLTIDIQVITREKALGQPLLGAETFLGARTGICVQFIETGSGKCDETEPDNLRQVSGYRTVTSFADGSAERAVIYFDQDITIYGSVWGLDPNRVEIVARRDLVNFMYRLLPY